MQKEERETARHSESSRYPILSQARAFPGLFVGMLGAVVATAAGVVLAQTVPVVSIVGALVVATPLAGLALGLGIGWDEEVPPGLARRLHPVGVALLILPPVVGLQGDRNPMPSRGLALRRSPSR